MTEQMTLLSSLKGLNNISTVFPSAKALGYCQEIVELTTHADSSDTLMISPGSH